MEKPWGILSKHNLLICSNMNACDWHFRVVGGGTKFKFWLWNYYRNCLLHSLLRSLQEDTVLVHQNIPNSAPSSSLKIILPWFFHYYKIKKFIQHNKIPEYANRSTEDQLHSSAFLCWSYFIFILDKDLFQTCRQSMDMWVIIDQTPEN